LISECRAEKLRRKSSHAGEAHDFIVDQGGYPAIARYKPTLGASDLFVASVLTTICLTTGEYYMQGKNLAPRGNLADNKS
jgi:hypothetical protein